MSLRTGRAVRDKRFRSRTGRCERLRVIGATLFRRDERVARQRSALSLTTITAFAHARRDLSGGNCKPDEQR